MQLNSKGRMCLIDSAAPSGAGTFLGILVHGFRREKTSLHSSSSRLGRSQLHTFAPSERFADTQFEFGPALRANAAGVAGEIVSASKAQPATAAAWAAS